ncbi:ATP-binding protein [Proteiniphilum sp.]|uniref:ATP-dependent nuclease n=1 Tax=Proteiniphilum sp. TaxID=1926877 RepID=UPI00331ABDF6
MSRIHSLEINNFRGLKHFEHIFTNQSFVCLIGRGDSGKSTILNALDAVLSPNWYYRFYDTDFYDGNTNEPILIETSIRDVPDELLSDTKFGLYKRLLNENNEIIDDFFEETPGCIDILTIRLTVEDDLEPKWHVVSNREGQEEIEIRASDRARFNLFIISDYIDRHFTWGKGSPLYALLKRGFEDIDTDGILVNANRKAYQNMNQPDAFAAFNDIISKIKKTAASLGLPIEVLQALIDLKNILVTEGNISLHDNTKIPFRLKGKGTRRLLSIAIQLELVKAEGGIILIDEVEQGLEPDRVKFLVKQLKKSSKGQVFVTTHSNNVLVELDANNIFLKKENQNGLFSFNEHFQGCLRRNPNAFFAKRVIVCEGATEVGICRALDNYRIKNDSSNIEHLGISLVDGTGSRFVEYCVAFKNAGFDVCAFCDSDDSDIKKKKIQLEENGIKVIDCNDGNSIEQQLFHDLPWSKVRVLLEYAAKEKSYQSITTQLSVTALDSLEDSDDNRKLIGEKAKGQKEEKGWFKNIEHGEKIGTIWFDSLNEIKNTRLFREYEELMAWIDKK